MNKHLTNLQAHPAADENVAGWQATGYVLSTAARGSEKAAPPVVLADGDVLELELENGTRLLVAAEDAERYLGRAIGRDGGGAAGVPGEIAVGPTLRLTGPHLPPVTGRDGLGAWALRSLRVFRTGPAGMTALAAAGTAQDWQLGQRLGLYHLQTDVWKLSPLAQMPSSTEPALLFLHGTISSTEGSFHALWGGDSEVDARAQLALAYGDRIYGFEHRSLTDSPITNVLALVKSLPVGARLHVVSHSRGGMLGELLARANRIDNDPFTEADIQRFLTHAQNTQRKGFDQQAQDLRALNQAMKERAIRVERFVRVAATARGTTLASGRLDRWASVMLNLPGLGLAQVPGLQAVAQGYTLLKNFLLAVVKERIDARVLPGLEAMMPDSPLVALLNAPDVRVEFPLHVIAGDFDGDSLLSWLGDCLSESFYGGQTDLVVNTPSMSGGAVRRQGIWLKSVAGPAVHHLSYFKRSESGRPLLSALAGANEGFVELIGPSSTFIARGGVHTKPRQDGPIALMLPGIMGSHLAAGRRIWMNPLEMIAGGMDHLRNSAAGVTPDGWMDIAYERFAQHLAQSHEVRPFAFDWRLSIADAADRFGPVLDAAMTDAEQRQKPLRIVAHSLGGLVARLALKDRWPRFNAIHGSRLVQFGTPNAGSHSIAAVLTGRDGFVQMIERWLDWKHDMREFLDIVRDFPGVLQLLPWPGEDGKATDGLDYFDPALWQQWRDEDAENRNLPSRDAVAPLEPAEGAGDGWDAPLAAQLVAARLAVQQIIAATLDPDHTLYVAGSARTPVALRVVDGQMQIGWTDRGDGRVAWDTGIPKGAKAWYVDAAHGDLLKHEAAFDDYVKLLETGDCTLATSRAGARDCVDLVFTPAPLASQTLFPSEEEVVAAAMGGRPPSVLRQRAQGLISPVSIQIFHGSLATADTPVLIGAYANDSLRGSAKFLDKHLAGCLQGAIAIGRYPAQPGDAMVFSQPIAGAKPGGAIVVGLGAVGELQPGELTRALTQGLVEYARVSSQMLSMDSKAAQPLQLSAVLVGTGFAGLSVDLGMRSLFEALCRSNRLLEQAGLAQRIGTLCVFEDEESRAIAAATAAQVLARDRKYAGLVNYDGRIRDAQGRYAGANMDQSGSNGWHRVHITDLEDGGLRFTLVSGRARNEVDDEPSQRQAVDGLIRSATNSTRDQPGLSRTLFELMLPNGFKEALPDIGGVILAVDARAAAYPWELMRDEAAIVDAPLATRICLVRQLASPHGRSRVTTVNNRKVLVVGDTESGLPALPAAQQEGRRVAELFRDKGHQVNLLEKPDGQQVMVNLFDERYRVIHLAAHGTVAVDGKGHTGMVLGPDTYLTTAQVNKLRHVPELVFINCCHLGSMKTEDRPRWGELAANLATQFIEMGCKAVVAAGWAVDDAAADTFAGAFYRAMLAGAPFGTSVRNARHETWRLHPASNTWGAYQAYGDELYTLIDDQRDEWQAPDYLHVSQVISELERMQARIGSANEDEEKFYAERLRKIELAIRARYFHMAEVRECLGAVWADLGDKGQAIEHYRAASVQTTGSISMRALEQLANLEIQHGAELLEISRMNKAGNGFMNAGLARIRTLLKLGITVERLSILGSHWKLRARYPKKANSEDEITSALKHMLAAYYEASDLSLQLCGDRDYYPSLNVMDGAVVLAARGDKTAFSKLTPMQALWLLDVQRNSRRRFAEERDFFHAYAEVDAARVGATWAMLNGRKAKELDEEDALKSLVRDHVSLFKRMGNPRTHDSALNQLRWLIALLPSDGEYSALRAALRKLQSKIENA